MSARRAALSAQPNLNRGTAAGQGRRWPLHPPPFPDETATSWLNRMAAAYRISTEDFLAWFVGLKRARGHDLDLTIPKPVARELAVGTGLDERRIQAMALDDAAFGVPTRFECFGARACLLLGRDVPYIQHRQWCPACLAEDAVPYPRRTWRLTPVVECPVHRAILAEDSGDQLSHPLTASRRESPNRKSESSVLGLAPVPRPASKLQRLVVEGLGSGHIDLGWTSIPADRCAATFAIADAILIACDPDYQPWVKLVRLSYESSWTPDVRPINMESCARRALRLARLSEALLDWPHFVRHTVIEDGTGFIAATEDQHNEVPIGACDAMRLQAWIDALPAPLASPFETMGRSSFRRFGRWLNRRWIRITIWEDDLLAASFLDSRAALVSPLPGSA